MPRRNRDDQIDPQVNIAGNGIQSPETILWMTLYPLSVGGLRTGRPEAPFNWVVPDAPRGRRWRSIRTSLGPTGSDLSRVETAALARGLRRSLAKALKMNTGPTITYVEEAGAVNPFTIYGNEGSPCPRCKRPLAKMILGGRGTVFCSHCQR